MKILIIEDDHIISSLLVKFLKDNFYTVDLASDGEKGLNLATVYKYDLIISDFLLPKLNGEEIIKKLRDLGNNTPILVMSVCGQTKNKISLINHGADDYLPKPFLFTELLARIKAILRREPLKEDKNISISDLSLDLKNQEAARNNKKIYLTNKEFCLLKLLMKNPGVIFDKQRIIEEAWDEVDGSLSNIVEAYILKLRKKIDFKKPFFIKTVPGRGYRLEV